MLVLLMKERNLACWAQCGWKKDELSLASVHLKKENWTAKCECSARISNNTTGTQVREQDGRNRCGLSFVQTLSRKLMELCNRRKSPAIRLNFQKCSETRTHREEKPEVETKIKQEGSDLPWKWAEGISRFQHRWWIYPWVSYSRTVSVKTR